MLNVTLKRIHRTDSCTLGKLLVNHTPLCYTLEPPWLNNVSFESCIPTGFYNCHKFSGDKHKNVWEVTDVPHRGNILLGHIGNTAKDTEGCILTGKYWSFMEDELAVTYSEKTLDKLRKMLPDDFVLQIFYSGF